MVRRGSFYERRTGWSYDVQDAARGVCKRSTTALTLTAEVQGRLSEIFLVRSQNRIIYKIKNKLVTYVSSFCPIFLFILHESHKVTDVFSKTILKDK